MRGLRLVLMGGLGGAIAVLSLQAFFFSQAASASEARQRELDVDLGRFGQAVIDDHHRWQRHPLLSPRDGGDAAALLSAWVGWPGARARHAIPDELIERFRDAGVDWVSRPDLDVSAFDLGWMRELSTFGYWDLEGPSSPLATRHVSPGDTEPRYVSARGLARVRLRQGLDRGELATAAAEVRELARLLLTAERVNAEMFAISLLTLEREALEESRRRGQALGGWSALSAEEVASLKRALWSAQLWTSLYEARAVESDPAFPAVGRCAALSELTSALAFRAWASWPFSERYLELTNRLETSDCRLRRLRRAWRSENGEGELRQLREVCAIAGESCEYDERFVWLPFGRGLVGHTLVAASMPDWLLAHRQRQQP